MLNNSVLTESEIEDGLILACQALAVSDELDIDFDDVQTIVFIFKIISFGEIEEIALSYPFGNLSP